MEDLLETQRSMTYWEHGLGRFASSLGPGGQLQLDNIHLSSAGHRLFADRLIDFMVGRGFWRRR